MKQRVIYGTLFAIVTLAMIVSSVYTRVLFFLACCLISCHEMRGALKKCDCDTQYWPPALLCATGSFLLFIGKPGYVIPAFMVIMIALFGQMILFEKISVKSVLATLAICAYPLSPILLMVYIAGNDLLWAAVFLNSILPTIMSDTFALFGGRRFGKRKLSPRVSPNKTVEGLFCGLAAGTLSGFLVHFILSSLNKCAIPLWAEVLVALFASLAGVLGDLVASAIKREAKIKDYSHLIPGHGGMLDRVDSNLFAVPVAYLIYVFFV